MEAAGGDRRPGVEPAEAISGWGEQEELQTAGHSPEFSVRVW